MMRRAILGSGLAALFATPSLAEDTSLLELAQARGLLIGAMVTLPQVQSSPELIDCIRQDVDLIVPGLEMKWSHLHPTPGVYDFAEADRLVAFGNKHKKKVRGHTLLWHQSLPVSFELAQTPPAARLLIAEHIRSVCRRYNRQIHSWDVVNEPIFIEHGEPGGLRASQFYRALGRDYIRFAFETAAEADPHARLVLNDYNLEQSGPDQDARRNAILELLNRLVQVGAPVHALGIQGHIDPKSSAFDPMGLQRFVRDVAGLGLDVYVTELDILDRRMDADIGLRDAEVAEAFGTFLRILLTERAVKLVSFWGLGDQQSWMNSSPYTRRRDGLRSRGHLYDDAWHRKPAWHAVAASLRQRPLVSKGQL